MKEREEPKRELAVCWFEGGLGAIVASTALLSKVKDTHEKVVVCSAHSDVFDTNPKVDDLYTLDDGSLVFQKYLCMKNVTSIKNQYMHYRPTITGRHIIYLMHLYNGLEWDGRLPELFVQPQEFGLVNNMYDPRKKRALIHINGSTIIKNGQFEKWNFNKEVKEEHWDAAVKTLLKKGYEVIQVGHANEVPIEGTRNLLGKTNVRQLIVLTSLCNLVVSVESSVAHIASALKKPACVFYTSTSPTAFGYETVTPIEPSEECRYCGRPETFWGDNVRKDGRIYPWSCRNRKCMESISVKDVEKIVAMVSNKAEGKVYKESKKKK
jgi:hypothetical protein